MQFYASPLVNIPRPPLSSSPVSPLCQIDEFFHLFLLWGCVTRRVWLFPLFPSFLSFPLFPAFPSLPSSVSCPPRPHNHHAVVAFTPWRTRFLKFPQVTSFLKFRAFHASSLPTQTHPVCESEQYTTSKVIVQRTLTKESYGCTKPSVGESR
eukprot:g71286.t1